MNTRDGDVQLRLMGNPRVRGPRLELADKELAQVQKTIRDSLRTRPNLSSMPAIPVAR